MLQVTAPINATGKEVLALIRGGGGGHLGQVQSVLLKSYFFTIEYVAKVAFRTHFPTIIRQSITGKYSFLF